MTDPHDEFSFGGRFRVPTRVYHGVPKGWSQAELLATHAALKGSFPLIDPAAPEPTDSPPAACPPAHREWLLYLQTLRRIGDGVRAGDAACIELAVRYLELRHIGSGSGYLRQTLARRLRQASLSRPQLRRLNRHFLELVQCQDFTQEFREYLRLWRRILDPETRAALLPLLARHAADPRWHWLPALLEAESGAGSPGRRGQPAP